LDSLGIQVFLAIVRYGTLTGAANSLFLSQSSLSHRLTQLEESVGMTLIERGRGLRSLSLTANGEEFLIIAKKWEELIQETKYIRSQKKQSLTIGAVDSIHNFILPPVYKALNNHSSEINIRFKTYLGDELYSLLQEDKIDVAFALFEKPVPNLIVKRFYSEPMVVLKNDKTASTSFEYIDFSSLEAKDELYHQWSPSFQTWYERNKGDREFSGIRVDSALLIYNLMHLPNKWIIVPLSMAKTFMRMGTFSIYRLNEAPPDRVYYQVRPRHPRTNSLESLQILDSYLDLINHDSTLALS
jgi:DNA-binding transcriptional LysR family regulator